MRRVRGSKLVVEALLAEGVRHTFGIPGTHNIELYDALAAAPGIEAVLVTDEQAGAFVADGYSRSSDRVGVLNLVPGAGVTHALSGIAEAWMDQVPMVVLACGIRADTGAAFQLHSIDQLAVLRPVTKESFTVHRAADIVPLIRRAFAIAKAPPAGPVAVEIPANLMMLLQDVDDGAASFETPVTPTVDVDLVREAARLLNEASRPALYLGAGAAGAGELLVELAERLGSPVTTTVSGKGVFPEHHPLWLWNGFGAQAPRFVQQIMDPCDCLLAVGCRFSEVATGSYGIEQPQLLIHVDIDPEVFNRNFRADLSIPADARDFVECLLQQLSHARTSEGPRPAIARGHEDLATERRCHSARGAVTPARLFAGLQEHTRDDAVFVTDSGNGTFLAMEHLRIDPPRRFIGPIDFSCMGYSVPAAIGAAFASPGREVVAIAGDGALLMTGLELLTAASYGAAPTVCVLRDGKLGQIAQFQKIPLNRESCSLLPDYDLETLARAIGCRFFRLVDDGEVDAVLPAALALSREGNPVIVEVMVDTSSTTFFTRGVLKTNFWRLPWRDRVAMLSRAVGRRLF